MSGSGEHAGLVSAVTDEGVELPVVDLTKPEFTVELDRAELEALTQKSLREAKRSLRLPAVARRSLARGSLLLGDAAVSKGFLTGMTTYLYKLGPDHLPAACTAFDRRLAGSILAVAIRLRLRAVAELSAEALAAAAAARRGASVHLVNIGGGPAADSLNTLLLVNARDDGLLRDRPVLVHLFDLDEAGPRFAKRCLAAMAAGGAPLQGLQVAVQHTRYDWADPSVLHRTLEAAGVDDAVAVGSSEGGLFEYGSDEDVAGNLRVLRDATPGDFAFVGSSLRLGELIDVMRRIQPTNNVLRTFERLTLLAHDEGWTMDHVVHDNPVYQIFRLRKR